MLKNYLKTALRNILRRRLYSFINILGLSTGMTFCLLILLFVKDEFSFDTFHTDSDRIYRVHKIDYKNDQPDLDSKQLILPLPLPEALKLEFGQIEYATHYRFGDTNVGHGGAMYRERVHYVSEDFNRMFTMHYVAGDPSTPLNDLKSVVISTSAAKKIFGRSDPIGETLVIWPIGSGLGVQRDSSDLEYSVTGVFEDLPGNSSLNCEILLRIENYPVYRKWKDEWHAYSSPVFVQFLPETSPGDIGQEINPFMEKYFGNNRNRNGTEAMEKYSSLGFTPLTDIHFNNSATGHDIHFSTVSNIQYSYILGAIALLTLLIACINYVLLSLTSSSSRTREVGVRKVLGATKQSVRWQFQGEAFVLVLISMALALALTEIFLPTFNDFTGKMLQLSLSENLELLAAIALLAVLTGWSAGSYPAEILSRFAPVKVLQAHPGQKHGIAFGRVLVIFQFTICTVFIVCTVVMYRQMKFISEKDLGFDKEQVVVVKTENAQGISSKRLIERFENDLSDDPKILGITGLYRGFGQGLLVVPLELHDKPWSITYVGVDRNFFRVMGIKFLEGSGFSSLSEVDVTEVVINQTLADWINSDDIIGSKAPIRLQPGRTRIVGVIPDFNFHSLEDAVLPMCFQTTDRLGNLLIRVAPGQIPAALQAIERSWKKNVHGELFSYSFLDDDLMAMYGSYERWMHIMGTATLFGILIACLGLFGLNGLITLNRTKEIGIRKVFGARVRNILLLLNRETLVLVVIAAITGIPLSYYAMDRWLENFAYRVPIGLEIFLISLLAGVMLVALTVSYHSVRAALADPVKSIRYE